MAQRRSCASGTISFGLVTIPVKFYLAASAEGVHFCYLAPETGNRVEQVYRDKITGDEISRNVMGRGYEYAKDKVVSLNVDDIKALEEKDNGSIDIKEFVTTDQVDLLHVEKSYHLSPGKGGDKAYTLLSLALKKTNQYAVAQWNARGKMHLVILRPYNDGLVLHQMYYANEIREFESDVAKTPPKDSEIDMACMLIKTLSNEKYDASKYVDVVQQRVKKFIEAKLEGRTEESKEEKTVVHNITDLFATLQASLNAAQKKVSY